MGQVISFEQLQLLNEEFEQALLRYGINIESGSDLEAACLSVLEIFGRRANPQINNPHEDIRVIYTEVLGIWIFLAKIVRLHYHQDFNQFIPHLKLLNKGTVAQNKRSRPTDESTNKIFELLFALALLDIGEDLILDHPSLAKGDNPDILVTIENQRWGFACKTIYGLPAQTLLDNLEKGVDQIQKSEAAIGCVVVNFRNLLNRDTFWPIVNLAEYHNGAEPIFGASLDPLRIPEEILNQVTFKKNQIMDEIGRENVLRIFEEKKCIPGFLAFCQACAGVGALPSSILTLVAANFVEHRSMPILQRINNALHDRVG